MPTPHTELPGDEIVRLYVEEKQSASVIASRLGVSRGKIRKWLDSRGLTRRRKLTKIVPGERYGDWLVLEEAERQTGTRKAQWLCRCLVCNNTEKPVSAWDLVSGGSTKCTSCAHAEKPGRRLKVRGSQRYNWVGHGKLPGNHWSRIKKMAADKGRDVEVTIEEAWRVYENQEEKCALTGVPIAFGTYGLSERTASLDRINSDRGYVPGNIQWVHKTVNMMKQRLGQDDFIAWCALVAAHAIGMTQDNDIALAA